ncbi:MAG TPA: hypothetical protein PKA37_02895 [Planctomycetota bacterium]|jgi:hypothetical protein|nr:hypothetical protein [Planctomycetota bacterium]
MAGVKEEAVNFVLGYLSKNPDMPMRELQDLGEKKGINVYPLIMGLAKKKLGIGRAKRGSAGRRPVGRPRGTKSGATAAARRAPAAKSTAAAAKPATSASKDPANMLSNFLSHMKSLEHENQVLREKLAKITAILR